MFWGLNSQGRQRGLRSAATVWGPVAAVFVCKPVTFTWPGHLGPLALEALEKPCAFSISCRGEKGEVPAPGGSEGKTPATWLLEDSLQKASQYL